MQEVGGNRLHSHAVTAEGAGGGLVGNRRAVKQWLRQRQECV